MNRIIKSYLNAFSVDNSFDTEDEGKQFEYFVNYCLAFEQFPGEIDCKEITSDAVDSGIDGIVFIIDNEIATTLDEAKSIFKRPKKNIDVSILFIQSKTSERYDLGEILKFTNGVSDFVSTASVFPHGDFLKEAKIIFDYIIDNVSKVTNGRPSARLYYVCTTTNDVPTEIEAARTSAINNLEQTGLFSFISFEYIDTNKLIILWQNTTNVTNAILGVQCYAAYPVMTGITEAYVAIVSIKEFISKILVNAENKIRINIFEENVRAFLGEENPVNDKMKETLNSAEQNDKFAILNNGITIISPDVRVQGNNISLENYQIVNGCQTSNVLYENRNAISENTYVTVKIIEVTDNDIIADIVRATNNQSKVEENQFLSFNPFIKRLEMYFNSIQDVDGEYIRLYFERRLGQYKSLEVPQKKVLSITEVGRALGALFLGKPDLASRYPNKYISEMSSKIFDQSNKEEAFYVAALVDYRLKSFYQKNKVLYDYAKYKWHIITIFGYLATHSAPPPISNARKVELYSKKIKKTCLSDEKMQLLVTKIPDILKQIGLKDNRDEVRSAGYAKDVLAYCNNNLKE